VFKTKEKGQRGSPKKLPAVPKERKRKRKKYQRATDEGGRDCISVGKNTGASGRQWGMGAVKELKNRFNLTGGVRGGVHPGESGAVN